MKIFAYTVLPYESNDSDIWHQLFAHYLKHENNKYRWAYHSCITLPEKNIKVELAKRVGYLLPSFSNTDITTLKLISDCSEEELDNHVRGL